MQKRTIFLLSLLFTSLSFAATDMIPDCRNYNDKSLDNAIITNLDQTKSKYMDQYLGNDEKNIRELKIERLSSYKISDSERNVQLYKKAKQFGYSKKELDESGLREEYKLPMYKQIYKLTSDKNVSFIVETYGNRNKCTLDIGRIFVLKDEIKSIAPEYFISRGLLE